MVQLSEAELAKIIQGGEANPVELKVAAPRATERLPASQFREMNEFVVTFQKAPALHPVQEQPVYFLARGTM